MTTLFFTAIITSFLDSLNPFAISQQFILQSTIKKRYHIWFYIIALFTTNYLCGTLAYYGFLNPILFFLYDMIDEHPQIIFTLKITFIFLLSILFVISLIKIKQAKQKEANQQEKHYTFKSLRPFYLIIIGIITTLSELSTSLPYFTFLTILFSYQLYLYELLIILFLYNFIYCLPLMMMYFIYRRKQYYFDKFYLLIKHYTNKWTPYLPPILSFIVIIFLFYTFI